MIPFQPFLTVEKKEDTPEKLAAVAGKPTKNHLFAPEINAIVSRIKTLYSLFTSVANNINAILTEENSIDLGTIVGSFLTPLNAVLKDYASPFYVKYKIGAIEYIEAFVGERGDYGGAGTLLTEADFYLIWRSDEDLSLITPTLQQILEAGNTTTLDINTSARLQAFLGVNSNGPVSAPSLEITLDGDKKGKITSNLLTANKNYELPPKSGTFALLDDVASNQWTENFEFENFGTLVIRKVIGYVGGVGTLPTELSNNIGKYNAKVGGFTTVKADATVFTGGVKITTFVDGAFTTGAQVVKDGLVYEATANTVLGEIPGSSSKWKFLTSKIVTFLPKSLESVMPIPLVNQITNTSNTSEFGYYIPETDGKEITGITIKAAAVGAITYGICDFDVTNKAINFVTKGSLASEIGIKFYEIAPILMGVKQGIWLKGNGLFYYMSGVSTQRIKSFLGQAGSATLSHTYNPSFFVTIKRNNENIVYKDLITSATGNSTDLVASQKLATDSYRKYIYDNEVEGSIKLSDAVAPTTNVNANEFGYYFPNMVGKELVGVTILTIAVAGLEIAYGVADIGIDNKASNFVQKGILITKAAGINEYLFTESLVLGTRQGIWLKGGARFNNLPSNPNSPSKAFLNGASGNDLQTGFFPSFFCIFKEDVGFGIAKNAGNIKKLDRQVYTYDALGDSITWGSFGGDDPAGATPHGNSYAFYLSQLLGTTTFRNRGIAGDSTWYSLKAQVDWTNGKADLITVAMGANDAVLILGVGSTIVLGDVSTVLNMVNDNPIDYASSTLYNDSVLGRFRWCMERLRVLNPNAKIFYLTQPDAKSTSTAPRRAMFQSIRNGQEAICSFLGIPTINLLREGEIFNAPLFDSFLYDELHPVKRGYKMMAGKYFQKIKEFL